MKLNRSNTEIRTQHYSMDAEGTSNIKPSESDVVKHLDGEGWFAYNIGIFYDNMQQVWRWNCSIKEK